MGMGNRILNQLVVIVKPNTAVLCMQIVGMVIAIQDVTKMMEI